MYIAVPFRTLQDLINLFLGDVMADPAVIHVLSHITHTDTVITADLTGSLSTHGLLFSAGALGNAPLVIHIDPARKMFHRYGLILHTDCLFHRDHVHTDTGTSGRYHLRDTRQRELCHQVEEGRQLWEFIRQFFLHHHKLGGTRDKDRQLILTMLIRRFRAVLLNDPDPAQALHHRLGIFKAHAVPSRQLLDGIGHTGFPETEKELHLFFCQDHIQHPVFRITVIDLFGELLHIAVCDQGRQFQYQLLFFRIGCHIIRILPVISFVDHRIPFFRIHRS